MINFRTVMLFALQIHICNSYYSAATTKATKPSHEFFTAASDMEILWKVEKKLAKKFLSYYKHEVKRIDDLEEKIRQIELSLQPRSLKSGHDELWVSRITNSYSAIKRFINFWPQYEEYKKEKIHQINITLFRSDIERLKRAYPSEEDLKGSLEAVIRLQDTYAIKPSTFIEGLAPYSHKLKIEEIFEIGFLCVGLQDFYHAQKWFKEALYRFPPGASQIGFVEKVSLLEYLAWSEYKIGNLESALKHTKNLLQFHPTHEAARVNVGLFENELLKYKDDSSTRQAFQRVRPNWESKYDVLCQGREKMEQKIIDILYCKFESHKARFILKPLKVEYVYNDPEIIIYHDFLRDSEMSHIKKAAYPLLGRATVHHPVTGELVFADYRVSKTAWLSPEMDPIAAQIIKKVGDTVNLDMRYAEELQISNYGLAGQYEPHWDHSTNAHQKPFKKFGSSNRIATMLMYMSDVYWGGSTVFTDTGPGVAITPEKGSAVFWFNLLRNGQGNPKTRHAACPVVVGQKWVSNLWIHEQGQEFLRPCSLNKDE